MSDIKSLILTATCAVFLSSGGPFPAAAEAHPAIPAASRAQPTKPAATPKNLKVSKYKGWDYLAEKLIADGLPEAEVRAIYQDRRMPYRETVYFSLRPKESHDIYSGFKSKSLIRLARDFLARNRIIFDEAEKIYKVSRYAIASIMLVETHFGRNTGNHLVINRLSRVATVAEPPNLQKVYLKLSREDPEVTFEEVEARAKYLEERFYPEILALINVAKRTNMDLMDLKGSYAGAFGIPQFLPSTFLQYAVDGNKDGRISLFHVHDAALSVANFLSSFGWNDNLTREQKGQVIWRYNHSEAYVDTILAIAEILAQPESSGQVKSPAPRGK